MALSVGSTINAVLADHQGKSWRVPEDLTERAAIFFVRHLGCPLCQEKIDEIKKNLSSFLEQDLKVFVVVQATPKRALQYAEKENLRFSLVPDREKKLYGLFQVPRGGFKEFTSPSVLKSTIRATLKGHLHGKFEGDEMQIPASFLVSPKGEILFAHYGKDIQDFGSISQLLGAARKAK